MFILGRSPAEDFGNEVVFGEEANGFGDVVGAVVGDGVTRGTLVASGDEAVESERVEVRGGDLFLKEAA